MRTQFAMWGNSLALRIPHTYAREMCAAPGRPVEMTLNEGRLVVEPVNEMPVYSLADLLEGMTEENAHREVETGHAVGNEFA
jgi:antitoxin MazE